MKMKMRAYPTLQMEQRSVSGNIIYILTSRRPLQATCSSKSTMIPVAKM